MAWQIECGECGKIIDKGLYDSEYEKGGIDIGYEFCLKCRREIEKELASNLPPLYDGDYDYPDDNF